ncbi:MAG: oxygen-independent coproporphyrinogen III oxidase [Clostridia bacterium]|nr:oxygen-independent coproporphyrinogen III oxidase [Clostridia bacterium]
MRKIGLYVHIPFCKQKCKYCDFVSFSEKEDLMEEYIECLCQEIEEVGQGINLDVENKICEETEISTIYIGGGTPSYIKEKYIAQIMQTIYDNYIIEKNTEITIEINPGTVNEEKIKKYKELGINRLSIGVQSTKNKLLNMLGRIHTYEEFTNTFDLARKAGFDNINIDFMIGLPNQTMEDIEDILTETKKLNPEHISIYSLILEDGTPMSKMVENKELYIPNDDLERNMYWRIKGGLEELGYIHYEISNFAKPGMESKHNSDCWEQKEYMGFGAAAHSYIDNARFSNIDSIEEYIKNYKEDKIENNFIFHEKQNLEAKMKEYMILGLRKITGIDCSKFENNFSKDVFEVFSKEIEKLIKEELIEIDDGYIKLSDRGIDLANIVWEEFV